MQLIDWINQKNNKSILKSFSIPKTPTIVKNELNIKKFNLKPFLNRKLIKCLNPNGYKGRIYSLTDKARKILNISTVNPKNNINYEILGRILGSPKQRFIVLTILSKNSSKRTSEEIRLKASNLNPCLSRISTKNILNELIDNELINTEIGMDRRRYYWINKEGMLIANFLSLTYFY